MVSASFWYTQEGYTKKVIKILVMLYGIKIPLRNQKWYWEQIIMVLPSINPGSMSQLR